MYTEFEKKSFDGLNLHFQLWQPNGDARGVICLVHALGEHGGRYSHWAELFIRESYAFIAYDLRGHGKSEGLRGHVSSFEDYFKDTDLLLEEAKSRFPGIPHFLYGHSLGGIIVTEFVLRRKPTLNGIIVTALSNRTSLQEQKIKVMMSKLLGSIVPRLAINTGLIPTTISRDPSVVEKYITDPLVHKQVTVGWGKNAIESIEWSEQHAGEWHLPVLFMHGELDQLGYPEGSRIFSDKIQGDHTLKIWAGMYHEVHNEPEKQIVFNYVLDWINRHTTL